MATGRGSSATTRWPSCATRDLFGDLVDDERFTRRVRRRARLAARARRPRDAGGLGSRSAGHPVNPHLPPLQRPGARFVGPAGVDRPGAGHGRRRSRRRRRDGSSCGRAGHVRGADEPGVRAEGGLHDRPARAGGHGRSRVRANAIRVGPSSSSRPPRPRRRPRSRRVEGGGHPGQPDPEPGADLGEQLDRQRVALAGRVGDERAGQQGQVAADRVAQDRAATGDPASTSSRASRTRALPEAYCSQQPRLPHSQRWPVGDDLHVPELAGHPVAAAEDLVVDDQGAADAGAEGDAEDVAVPDARRRTGTRPARRCWRRCPRPPAPGSAASAPPAAARRARPGAARTARSPAPRRRTRPRRCRPPRRRTPRSASSTSSTMVSSTAGTLRPGVGRRRAGQHGAEGVDDAAEHLGAADVDADRQRRRAARSSRGVSRGGRTRAWSRDYCSARHTPACSALRRTTRCRPGRACVASWPPCWSPHRARRPPACGPTSAGSTRWAARPARRRPARHLDPRALIRFQAANGLARTGSLVTGHPLEDVRRRTRCAATAARSRRHAADAGS